MTRMKNLLKIINVDQVYTCPLHNPAIHTCTRRNILGKYFTYTFTYTSYFKIIGQKL